MNLNSLSFNSSLLPVNGKESEQQSTFNLTGVNEDSNIISTNNNNISIEKILNNIKPIKTIKLNAGNECSIEDDSITGIINNNSQSNTKKTKTNTQKDQVSTDTNSTRNKIFTDSEKFMKSSNVDPIVNACISNFVPSTTSDQPKKTTTSSNKNENSENNNNKNNSAKGITLNQQKLPPYATMATRKQSMINNTNVNNNNKNHKEEIPINNSSVIESNITQQSDTLSEILGSNNVTNQKNITKSTLQASTLLKNAIPVSLYTNETLNPNSLSSLLPLLQDLKAQVIELGREKRILTKTNEALTTNLIEHKEKIESLNQIIAERDASLFNLRNSLEIENKKRKIAEEETQKYKEMIDTLETKLQNANNEKEETKQKNMELEKKIKLSDYTVKHLTTILSSKKRISLDQNEEEREEKKIKTNKVPLNSFSENYQTNADQNTKQDNNKEGFVIKNIDSSVVDNKNVNIGDDDESSCFPSNDPPQKTVIPIYHQSNHYYSAGSKSQSSDISKLRAKVLQQESSNPNYVYNGDSYTGYSHRSTTPTKKPKKSSIRSLNTSRSNSAKSASRSNSVTFKQLDNPEIFSYTTNGITSKKSTIGNISRNSNNGIDDIKYNFNASQYNDDSINQESRNSLSDSVLNHESYRKTCVCCNPQLREENSFKEKEHMNNKLSGNGYYILPKDKLDIIGISNESKSDRYKDPLSKHMVTAATLQSKKRKITYTKKRKELENLNSSRNDIAKAIEASENEILSIQEQIKQILSKTTENSSYLAENNINLKNLYDKLCEKENTVELMKSCEKKLKKFETSSVQKAATESAIGGIVIRKKVVKKKALTSKY